MPEPTTTKKKKKGFFQKLAQLVKDFVEWVEETFSDPELSAEIHDDLGLDRDNPATPAPTDGARRARIEAFAAKEDVDEASLLAVVADIKAEVDTIIDFVEAAKADEVDARMLFATMFKLFALDVLRVRNPAPTRWSGWPASSSTTRSPSSSSTRRRSTARARRGPGGRRRGWVQRLSMLGGVTLVVLATVLDALGGVIDAVYGWDPDPEDEGEAAAIASRALTVTLDHALLGRRGPALTLIPVPRGARRARTVRRRHAGVSLPMTVGATTYTFDIAGAGQFGLSSVRHRRRRRTFASFAPTDPGRCRAVPAAGPPTPKASPSPLRRWTRPRSSSARPTAPDSRSARSPTASSCRARKPSSA